ncbi:lytic transglycosylase domain-containing protein [Bartonella sp. DGB2]|uniref:lytic transglycosylase domain-containing protein n=1 Tax=Bartonella sp. DGB2 TaxID=3388426 RepID=UPI00398FA617
MTIEVAPTLKRPYAALIGKFAAKHKVPVELAHAVIFIESNYNSKALGSAGEVGLMQIKPSTARALGYQGTTKQLYSPETNLDYGMRYLAKAYHMSGGDTCSTILKYNAGHGATRMNPTSKRYCSRVQTYLTRAQK